MSMEDEKGPEQPVGGFINMGTWGLHSYLFSGTSLAALQIMEVLHQVAFEESSDNYLFS